VERVHGLGPAGGSAALEQLIEQHGAALVYDFRAYLGLNLWDVLFTTSPRLLLAWIEGLPEDSAFIASVREAAPYREPDPHAQYEPDWRGWTRLHSMIADLFDAVNLNTAATGNYKKRPTFEPWPRPKKRRPKRVADIRRMFGN
jgi:hypothetical protein